VRNIIPASKGNGKVRKEDFASTHINLLVDNTEAITHCHSWMVIFFYNQMKMMEQIIKNNFHHAMAIFCSNVMPLVHKC